MYASVLNHFPLVIPAVIFVAALFSLLPFAGPYSAVIALVLAAKMTEVW